MKRALFLFAPKFCEFGADIAHYLHEKGGLQIVHGVCTGGNDVVLRCAKHLGGLAGEMHDIEMHEETWLNYPTLDFFAAQRMRDELGVDIVGRVLVSDRRIGAGFVSGGILRPSRFERKVQAAPVVAPTIYAVEMYKFFDDMLSKLQPDYILFYAIAGAPALLLAELCRSRNIRIIFPLSARVDDLFIIDDDPKGRFLPVSKIFNGGNIDFLLAEMAWAKECLNSFRGKPVEPDYMRLNAARRNSRGLTNELVKVAKVFLRNGFFALWAEDSREKIERSLFDLSVAWKKHFFSGDYSVDSSFDGMKIVFFPLHVDPEASTMVLSPCHTDQLSVIEAIAKALPVDSILIVKENPSMIGLRPKGFYKRIRSLPRVVLVGPAQSGLYWVRKSHIVVVITGTAAWEALRLGIPAIVIGDSPFLAISQGIIHEPNLSALSNALARAEKMALASDEELIKYLAAIKALGFGFDASFIWGDYKKRAAHERAQAVKDISEPIIKALVN